MAPTAFVACIESGVLETQALRLFESIRRHAGALAGAPIHALSPRAGHAPSAAARRRLEELEVSYDDTVLNTECVEYGSANRVLAAARVEARHGHDVLVILDSDTLFLREPAALALPAGTDVAARPVDYKMICSAGAGDPADGYWRALAATCGVRLEDLPYTTTFVDGARVRASYNGGLVAARARLGVFATWADFFLRSVRAGLRTQPGAAAFRAGAGWVAPAAAGWWGSNQAALALAVWSTTRRVVELPVTYNYPLHVHAQVAPAVRSRAFAELVHVHYHWLLEPDALADNPLFAAGSPLTPAQRAWLWPA